MLGMGGQPNPEMLKQLAEKMPGGLPGAPGLPSIPGVGGSLLGGKLPGLGGPPIGIPQNLGKKK
jgi:signal recognition particle subunit SRP54